jgi:hypothetical protein
MLAISQLRLPKICQETHSPGQRGHAQRIPCPRIQQWPFRIVHPQSHVVGVFNALLQRQHLGVARYVAMTRNLRLFAGASCSRSLVDGVEPNSDKLKLALTALGRDRRFYEMKHAFRSTTKPCPRTSIVCQLCAEFIPATRAMDRTIG